MPSKSRRAVARPILLILLLGVPLGLLYRSLALHRADRMLLAAVRNHDLDLAKSALDAGADPNLRGYLTEIPAGSTWDELMRLFNVQHDNRGAGRPAPTMLLLAGQGNHPALIHLLLTRGADPNTRSNSGGTILMDVAGRGQVDLVDELVQRGAKINAATKSGETALARAIANNQVEAARELVRLGADPSHAFKGQTPLEHALGKGAAPAMVKLLLDLGERADARGMNGAPMLVIASGIDTPGYSVLRQSSSPMTPRPKVGGVSSHVQVIRMLLEHGAALEATDPNGRTALIAAAQQDHPDVMTELLDHHARINVEDKQGDTPLFFAAGRMEDDMINRLLANGAQINVPNHYGDTPLMEAARFNNARNVTVLLAHGARPDVQDNDGNTPLTVALMYRPADCIKPLLRRHTPVNRQNRWGETPLIIAARIGDASLVKLFIEAGADVNAQDQTGRTPLIAMAANLPQYFVASNSSAVSQTLVGQPSNGMPSLPKGFFSTKAGKALRKMEEPSRLEIIRLLLSRGAKVNVKDKKGKSALFYTNQSQFPGLIALLKKAGAR